MESSPLCFKVTGSNCPIYNCLQSRKKTKKKDKKVATFPIPAKDEEHSTKRRNDLIRVIKRYRKIDSKLRSQIQLWIIWNVQNC